MNAPINTIGERLKEVRTIRSLTLEEAARMTGVSKPMLGQIERGQSVPTITVLWKIATGLKVPLSAFLEQPQPEYMVVSVEQSTVISEDNGRMTAYPLFPYDPIRNVEIFQIEFKPGCNHISDRHDNGVEEYVLVQKGTLQLILNGQEITVKEKQAIRFKADVAHGYCNPFTEPCSVYNMIFYPRYEWR